MGRPRKWASLAEYYADYRRRNGGKIAARTRQWRVDNPEKARETDRRKYLQHKEARFARAERHRQFNAALADSYKVGGCIDCGNKNLTVLDFDHRSDKIKSVGFLTGGSTAKMLAEIAKCEVRCSNCHRIVTARRRKEAACRTK